MALGVKGAAAQAQPGQAVATFALGAGGEDVVTLAREQAFIADGSWGDDSGDFALHRAFAFGGIPNLFANDDRFAKFEQTGEITLGSVKRYARHRDRAGCGLTACGECDVQKAGCPAGIFKEQFIEIPHAIEQKLVWVTGLDAQVLPHHGGVRCGRGVKACVEKGELARRCAFFAFGIKGHERWWPCLGRSGALG